MESEKREAEQLLKKIEALETYVESKKYKRLTYREQNLCHQQLGAMQTYHKCLSARLVASSEIVDLHNIRCLDHYEIGCKTCFGNG